MNNTQELISQLAKEHYKQVENTVLDLAKKLQSAEVIENKLLLEIQSQEDVSDEKTDTSKELGSILGTGLAGGLASFALLFGELDRYYPEGGWDLKGHQFLVQIQEKLQTQGILSYSLYGGLAGIGLAAHSLSRQGTRYTKLLNTIKTHLLSNLPDMLEDFTNNLKQDSVKMTDYDVVQGVAGIGRYLLLYKDEPNVLEAIHEIIKYVIRLSKFKELNGVSIPGWHIKSENLFLESERKKFTNGNFNVGLAHGIPGPLAFLVLTKKVGIEIEGQTEAIERIVNWLLEWKREDEYGPIWPFNVSFEELMDGNLQGNQRSMEAWCYGSPGVARVIWMAGEVLGVEYWKEISVDSFKATFRRPMSQWNINAPNFCHGYAGLLQIAHRMYLDSGEKEILDGRNKLINKVLGMYNTEFPFGYYDIPKGNCEQQIVHNPGLLEGAAGTALVLLSLINDKPSDWDSIFLIV
ncbi:lanthionine synthetase C family protein [Cytobacillus sp. Hm23]